MQGYVGDKIDISTRINIMTEGMDGKDCLTVVRAAGLASPSIGRSNSAFSMARTREDALREAIDYGGRMFHDHVMEHFAIYDLRRNRARLADLVQKDIETLIFDMRIVSDFCDIAGLTPRRWVVCIFIHPAVALLTPTSPTPPSPPL